LIDGVPSPDWIRVVRWSPSALELIAAPLRLGGEPGPEWQLTVDTGEHLVVHEAVIGTRLPSFCPELHVNEDGAFCIGYRDYARACKQDIREFWDDLNAYLLNQDYASRRSAWPSGRWLSHGIAADYQLEAERLAKEAGWEAEYAAWLENKEGWLAGPLPRLSKDKSRLVNARTPCPRGCKSRLGRIIVRRACKKRQLLETLIHEEYARRAAEHRFFENIFRKKKRCCRRIMGCPLAIREDGKDPMGGTTSSASKLARAVRKSHA
jgi:hypothetical protein